jgi:formimidoylglutamate deiminase
VMIDAREELRLLEYGQRLLHRRRNVLNAVPGSSTGRALFDAVVSGGARAAGHETSGIVPGARADLFSLDVTAPALQGLAGDPLLDAWIFSSRERAVDCVWRGGAQVVRAGRHVHAEEVWRRYRAALHTLTDGGAPGAHRP